jgi:fructose-1,6-bisphosphatase/inositol monophosphatase family enzyme
VGPDLRFAHELADAADAVTLGRFRALDLRVESKPDLTPVSEADRAAEEAVRALVASRRPGEGAWADGTRCSVSPVARLEDAVVSTTSERDMPAAWRDVAARAWTARGFGDFWQHCLVAEGAVDAAADETLQLWDFAAVRLVVEEAGGRCSTFAGAPPAPDASFLATNGTLHDQVVSLLGS